ncbi:MAG: hypothetical protein LBF28_02785 [Rickettsiales bacterium]|jgi:hypothetical protein|nr:hypothetical protein [Rickettsiales bacterium]
MTEFEYSTASANTEKKPVFGTAIFLIIVLLIAIGAFVYVFFHGKKDANFPRPENIIIKEPSAKTAKRVWNGNYEFDDGLRNPSSATKYQWDEVGAGLAGIEIFNIDINNGGGRDRITRSKYENGTSHFYYEYKIELNANGKLTDITPNDFRTIEGAECSLQKLRFVFSPVFQIIKISRDWEESWATPTAARRTIYTLSENELKPAHAMRLGKICNVSDLF